MCVTASVILDRVDLCIFIIDSSIRFNYSSKSDRQCSDFPRVSINPEVGSDFLVLLEVILGPRSAEKLGLLHKQA